jgi:glutathione peroxidase
MSIYSIALHRLDGKTLDLHQFAGHPLLIVNVASKCGLTPQYAGLEALYQQYKTRGLNILGVPCNQFGAQEPGSPDDIATFCEKNFGVTFTLSEKVEVNGPQRHALYQMLIGSGDDIQWNFEKFLIGADGQTIARFGPRTEPNDPQISTLLNSIC